MRPISKSVSNLRHLNEYKKNIDIYLKDLMQKARNQGHNEVVNLSEHILMAGGKRIRPMLLLLTYEMLGGSDIEQILTVP